MDKNIWWALAIRNSICVICWTVLAIVFDKWGIALFSLLFLNTLKTQRTKYYYRICDKCGKHSTYMQTYDGAIEKARQDGWVYDKNMNKDYCPDCQ